MYKIDWNKFKNEKYKFVAKKGCPYFTGLSKYMNLPTDIESSFVGKKYKNKTITSPSILKIDKGEIKSAVIGSDKIPNWFKTKGDKFLKGNRFGYFLKPNKMVPEKLGTGTRRTKDYIPQINWGKFSMSPGNNRAGNAINCRESANWLYKNRNAPEFPLNFGSYIAPNMKKSYYDTNGKNGFDKVPKSIYDSGNVPLYNMSPYDGVPVGGSLPRPYGPRDNAMIKGYPGRPLYSSFGPYINQAYRPIENFGPYINQAYKSNEFGTAFVDSKPSFKPDYKRTYKPVFQTPANEDLYLPGWNPYEKNSFGPNNVAYRNPFLMYENPGGNTINFLTGKNYLPPCNSSKGNVRKVQKNNNPTGFLATAKPYFPGNIKQMKPDGKPAFGQSVSKMKIKMADDYVNKILTDDEVKKFDEYIKKDPRLLVICQQINEIKQSSTSECILHYSSLFRYFCIKGLDAFEGIQLKGNVSEYGRCIDDFFIFIHSKLVGQTIIESSKTRKNGSLNYFNNLLNVFKKLKIEEKFMHITAKLEKSQDENNRFQGFLIYMYKNPNVISSLSKIIKQGYSEENETHLIDFIYQQGNSTLFNSGRNSENKDREMCMKFLRYLCNLEFSDFFENTIKLLIEKGEIPIDNIENNDTILNIQDTLKIFLKNKKDEKLKHKFGNNKNKPVSINKPSTPKSMKQIPPWVNLSSGPYTTGMFNTGGQSTGSGFQRVGQPLELYNYQNNPAIGYSYPEFSGPRQWMGGFGQHKKQNSEKTKKQNIILHKVTKNNDKFKKYNSLNKISTKQNVKKQEIKKKIPKPGDTLIISKNKVKLKKSK